MIKALKDIEYIYNGRTFVLLGTGKNCAKYRDKIQKFIEKNSAVTIGMNNITDLFIPDFHLYTSNLRYKEYGHKINNKSMKMFGCHIKKYFREKHKNHVLIKYTDRKIGEKIEYRNECIYGYFRTSGNLAIMLAHIMGAKSIYCAGYDGFTNNTDGTTHYYKDKEYELKENKEWHDRYDIHVFNALDEMSKFIDFKIITPTIYTKHFDENIICLS